MNSAALIAASGISYRQLDYWCRAGFLGHISRQPLSDTKNAVKLRKRGPRYGSNGSGRDRVYTHEQVRRACILGAVARAGIDVRLAAEAFDFGFVHDTEKGVVVVLAAGVSVDIDLREIAAENAA